MTRLALVAMLASGCAVGAGSSRVGQWRAHRVIDSTACVEAPTGGCERTVAIGRDLPPRSFGGGLFAFATTGYAQLRRGNDVGHGAMFQGSYEYFRGRGGFALGGRAGVDVAVGFDRHLLFLTPVTAMAHLGGGWGSVYAGAGYAPVATESESGEMPPPATWHHGSFHALVGTRILLRETLSRAISIAPELQVQTFGDATLLSATVNVGIHL